VAHLATGLGSGLAVEVQLGLRVVERLAPALDIMPDQILQETELAELKKLSRQYKGKTNREIVVPRRKPAA
jgi:hypothetical protein